MRVFWDGWKLYINYNNEITSAESPRGVSSSWNDYKNVEHETTRREKWRKSFPRLVLLLHRKILFNFPRVLRVAFLLLPTFFFFRTKAAWVWADGMRKLIAIRLQKKRSKLIPLEIHSLCVVRMRALRWWWASTEPALRLLNFLSPPGAKGELLDVGWLEIMPFRRKSNGENER